MSKDLFYCFFYYSDAAVLGLNIFFYSDAAVLGLNIGAGIFLVWRFSEVWHFFGSALCDGFGMYTEGLNQLLYDVSKGY